MSECCLSSLPIFFITKQFAKIVLLPTVWQQVQCVWQGWQADRGRQAALASDREQPAGDSEARGRDVV